MASITEKPVVIVGGGVTGLVTAQLLLEHGIQVVVIEKLNTLGGLARSFTYDNGFVFDCGPHRFDVGNPNIKSYVERILGDNHTYFPRKSEVYFKGKYYGWPIKLKNLLQLPKDIALKALIDLTINGFKEYGEDNFQNYILRQYGPTLYKHFFEDYSLKFLGIHPNITHSDWAKVGINRAIINDNAQMQNLFQLLKTTFLYSNQAPQKFVYPKYGMQDAWNSVANKIIELGGTIITNSDAVLNYNDKTIVSVSSNTETFEASQVIWTAPINIACKQLDIPSPELKYLGLLLYNVMVREEAPRDYQWCYYGSQELIFNRLSTPKFLSPYTCPENTVGYCCEVTCMVGDEKWQNGERLTDWVVEDLIKVGMLRDRKNIIDIKIERLPNSYPIYNSTYPQDLALARKELSKFENFTLAGRTGLFWYNNMDHSMENAMQLTRKLLRKVGNNTKESQLASGLIA
jgi:protoporphyrinogen oxidase